MVYSALPWVKLGNFPSPETLQTLKEEGFQSLVNVSGIDLLKIYAEEQTSVFTISQHTFRDVFSEDFSTLDIAAADEVTPDIFINCTTIEERAAFHSAVTVVIENLKAQTGQYIFCHKGLGRSPCVLFAALARSEKAEYPRILKMIHYLNPKAAFSVVSWSAVNWYLSVPERPVIRC